MTGASPENILDRLTVVLTRPAYAGNVGAVARVMANFGVHSGVLVSPRCDINSLEARQYATGNSSLVLATMRIEKDMTETLMDANTVIAVTRRTGQMRQPTIGLSDVAGRLKSGRVVLVFGPEESGLTDADIANCTDVLTLDVSATMASINLSHAVAVVLSRVFEQCGQSPRKGSIARNRAEDSPETKNSVVSQDVNGDVEVDAATVDPSGTTSGQNIDVILAGEFLNLSRRLQGALRLCEASGRVTNAERLSRILSQTLARSNLDPAELAAWHGLISALHPA